MSESRNFAPAEETLRKWVLGGGGEIGAGLAQVEEARQDVMRSAAWHNVSVRYTPGDELALRFQLEGPVEEAAKLGELDTLALWMVGVVHQEGEVAHSAEVRARAIEVIGRMGSRLRLETATSVLEALGQISVEDELALSPFAPSTYLRRELEPLVSGVYRVSAAMVGLGSVQGCRELAKELLIQRVNGARELGQESAEYELMSREIEGKCLGEMRLLQFFDHLRGDSTT